MDHQVVVDLGATAEDGSTITSSLDNAPARGDKEDHLPDALWLHPPTTVTTHHALTMDGHARITPTTTTTFSTSRYHRHLAAVVHTSSFSSHTQHPTTTTTTFLVLLHLWFGYHVWTRRKRKQLLVTYQTSVLHRQYYQLWIAWWSHPPTSVVRRNDDDDHNDNEEEQNGSGIQFQMVDLRRRLFFFPILSRLPNPFARGQPWSGLPLLFYNAHLIWSCRALETVITLATSRDGDNHNNNNNNNNTNDTWHLAYARTLWSLSWIAMALDLLFTYSVLHLLQDLNYGQATAFGRSALTTTATTDTGDQSSSSSSSAQSRIQRQLVQRPMGSITVTTAALLMLFRQEFPTQPIAWIPMLSSTTLSKIPILGWPAVSQYLAAAILLLLSRSIHPIAAVTCGSLSGWLYVSEWTKFAAMVPYWSNGSLIVYAVLSLIAMRASSKYRRWVPCIDYVSWDEKGQWREDGIDGNTTMDSREVTTSTTASRRRDHGTAMMTVGLESNEIDGGLPDVLPDGFSRTSSIEEGTLPLFYPQQTQQQAPSSTASNQDSSTNEPDLIHHRLPMLPDENDEHDDTDDEERDVANMDHLEQGMGERDALLWNDRDGTNNIMPSSTNTTRSTPASMRTRRSGLFRG